MQKTAILTLTAVAAGILAAERFVTASGAYPTVATGAWGVTATSAAAAGDLVPVDVLGTTVVTAGGAFAKDATLRVGANGKAIAAESLTDVIVARALAESTGDGDRVEVFLIPNATPVDGGI
ncbi:MAG: DUF2190 family protein [Xanthomonadaceae bacterium]|nr:DUF2190 family protein [Xanthomonadaceae bacterium]